jgi:hypothetical protein
MTFGRPTTIPTSFYSTVPLPSAIDDDFLDTQEEGSAVRPDGQPCLMAFYPAQLHFYEIINDILLNMYMNSDEQQESVYDIVTVLRLDNTLISWNKNLASQLQEPCPPHLRGSSLQRLGIVNKVRYLAFRISFRNYEAYASNSCSRFLHTRILLFRPILAQFCLQRPDIHPTHTSIESLDELAVIQCSRLCLKHAHQMIELVYTHLDFDTVTGPLPSWWYCVLCTTHFPVSVTLCD